jgi:glutamate-1-semialdehyde 2,1-aminomutase
MFAKFFHAMLDRGIYLPPSQFEAMFVSLSHSEADLDKTIAAARESLLTLGGASGAGERLDVTGAKRLNLSSR